MPFSDDDSDENPLSDHEAQDSPSLHRAKSPKRMLHSHAGGTLTLDPKWERLMNGDESVTDDISISEMKKAMAVILRRLSKYEEMSEERDRHHMLLNTEHFDLKARVGHMQDSWKRSTKNLAVLPEVPTYDDIMDLHTKEPRGMTTWEVWFFRQRLIKVKDNSAMADKLNHILRTTPGEDGLVHWNLASVSARTQWQAYYAVFGATINKKVLTARTQAELASIDAAGPTVGSSFSGLSVHSHEDDAGFYEDDDDEPEQLGELS